MRSGANHRACESHDDGRHFTAPRQRYGPVGLIRRSSNRDIAIARAASDRTYRTKNRRTTRPRRVVAPPTGCLACWTLRMGRGVARRLIDPALLRTGCIARRTGLGNRPRRKLISQPPAAAAAARRRHDSVHASRLTPARSVTSPRERPVPVSKAGEREDESTKVNGRHRTFHVVDGFADRHWTARAPPGVSLRIDRLSRVVRSCRALVSCAGLVRRACAPGSPIDDTTSSRMTLRHRDDLGHHDHPEHRPTRANETT